MNNVFSFKNIGYAEGTSMLVLLFIAMPFKYLLDMPLAVKYVGWIHGLLFIVYLFAIAGKATSEKWPFSKTALAILASLIPFGPFLFHKKYD